MTSSTVTEECPDTITSLLPTASVSYRGVCESNSSENTGLPSMFWGNCDDFDFSMCVNQLMGQNRWMKQGPTSTLPQGTAALQKAVVRPRKNPGRPGKPGFAIHSRAGSQQPPRPQRAHTQRRTHARQVTHVYRWRDGTEISDVFRQAQKLRNSRPALFTRQPESRQLPSH